MNQISDQPPKKKYGCLNIILIVGASIMGLFFIIIFLSTIFTTTDKKVNLKEEKENIQQQIKSNVDSLKAKDLSKLFDEKYDKFEDVKWYEPKSKPVYRNQNGFYCYFSVQNNTPGNLRFVGQYASSKWLFIKKVTFNIDGSNFIYFPKKMEKDHNSAIWEWFDDQVDRTNMSLVKRIANAKKVSVRWEGDTYSDDKELSKSNIKSIHNTLEYYESLGGTILE